MDKELEAPCAGCTGYSNYVSDQLYASEHTYKPLKESIDEWFKRGNGVSKEDFWIKAEYDTVSKPKHYMLFEEEGIEVRDVIEKLVKKLDHHGYSGMFIADYVQMMQYLMRFMEKNGKEDLEKSLWYLPKLIEAYESDL
jgi:hypothetical protein